MANMGTKKSDRGGGPGTCGGDKKNPVRTTLEPVFKGKG